jgi:large subunit ribosomal protein L10
MSTREKKQVVVNELREKLKASNVTILADYRGLDVSAMTRLRRKLRESNSELKVAKNTLTRLAASEIGLDDLEHYLEGPTAIAFGLGDPVVPAKVMVDLTREFKQLEIKAGILEGKIIRGEEVLQLAELPSREVLLGKVVCGMQAPLYGLVNVFNASIRNLVYVLDAIHKLKKTGNVAG